MTNPATYINQTSHNVEIYTPPDIVAGWHAVLGEIDLDPASSEVANRSIRAKQIYTEPAFEVIGEIWGELDDGTKVTLPLRRYVDWGGLSKPWCGKVANNPPFGSPRSACKAGCVATGCLKRGYHVSTPQPGMNHWVNHFVGEHVAGRLTEGIFLCFAATSESWFQPLTAYPVCFPRKRTNYVLPDGTIYRGVTKGSCLHYVGPNVDRFAEVFSAMGVVKVPYVRG